MPTTLDKKLGSLPLRPAAFIEPMECLAVPKLLDSPKWVYEIKLDGYRALAAKSGGRVKLLSRRNKSFNQQYSYIAEALRELPEDTVLDGEIVALDESGRLNFNLLQNFRSGAARIYYFVFDLLIYRGRELTRLPLIERREILRSVLKFDSQQIRISDCIVASATDVLNAVREQGLEGAIGKRKDSLYESGRRSGAWVKFRVDRGQESVRTPSIYGAGDGNRIVSQISKSRRNKVLPAAP